MQEVNLTIIIPHFNTPDYLERLLNTIPLIDDIQVIVIDDRSTEKLEEYERCRHKFSESGVIFLRNEGTKGAGASRNAGLCNAAGKWLLFADADDVFYEGFYDILKPFFNTMADIVYFPYYSKEEGSDRESYRHLEMEGLIKKYYHEAGKENELNMKYKILGPVSKLIRREMVERNGILFDEVMHSNDVMFSIKTAFYSRQVAASPEVIYCAMRNDFSLTSCTSLSAFGQRIDIWINMYEFLRSHLAPTEFKILGLHGAGRIVAGIRSKIGFRQLMRMIIKFKKHKIPLVPHRLNKIGDIKKRLQQQFIIDRQEKKFLHK